jgi:CheY-like chemotaxis protein
MSSTKKILLIDDDEDDREVFVEVVTGLSPSIVLDMATNGDEGLRKLQSSTALPGIIFLDLNMPVMSGTEFLRKVKACDVLKEIPIVVLTTSTDQRSIREAKELGASDFITKPNKFRNWETELRRFIVEK